MRVAAGSSQKERIVLFGVLLGALLIRLPGVSYGFPYILNGDETLYVTPALDLLRQGDWNPHWFGHPGSVVMYPLALIFFVAAKFLSLDLNGPPAVFYLIGRVSMAFLSVYGIYLVSRLTARVSDKTWAPVFAAGLAAIMPLYATLSRVIRPDIPMNCLVTAAFIFLWDFLLEPDKRRRLWVAAALCGAAAAAKYPVGVLALVPVLWVGLRRVGWKGASAAAAIFGATFFLCAPFVFLDWTRSIPDILSETRPVHIGREALAWPMNHWWYLNKALCQGLGGFVLSASAAIGLGYLWAKRPATRPMFTFAFLYWVVIGFGPLRWQRWVMPMLPFAAVAFGEGMACLAEAARDSTRLAIRTAAFSLLVWTVASSAWVVSRDIRQLSQARQTDTRVLASQWIEENLPAGSKAVFLRFSSRIYLDPRFTYRYDQTQPGQRVNAQYLVVDGWTKDIILADPKRYSRWVAVYDREIAGAELLRVIGPPGHPGPRLEIYRLARHDSGPSN